MNDDSVTFTRDEFKIIVDQIRAEEREACAKWLRDNYQDYKNIADICEAIQSRGEK